MFAAAEETSLRVKVPEAPFYLRGAKRALLNANSNTSKKQSVFSDFFKNQSSPEIAKKFHFQYAKLLTILRQVSRLRRVKDI